MGEGWRSEERNCRYCGTAFQPRRRAQLTCSNGSHRWLYRDRVRPRVKRRDAVTVTDHVQAVATRVVRFPVENELRRDARISTILGHAPSVVACDRAW